MASPALQPEYAAVLAERYQSVQASLGNILAPGTCFVWEVGCGHGHFLTAYATAHPERVCVGIDLAGDRIARALRKRDRARLPNLHFIRADAGLFLGAVPPDRLIAELFVLFPDPWPKSRHHKHRVLQPGFFEAVATRATPECRIYFRTDHAPYFAETKGVIDRAPHWEEEDAPWPFEFETVFQSRAKRFDSLVARRRLVLP